MPTMTDNNCAELISKKMWEVIDGLGVFPGAEIDERTWEHLLVYVPERVKMRLWQSEAIKEAMREIPDGCLSFADQLVKNLWAKNIVLVRGL